MTAAVLPFRKPAPKRLRSIALHEILESLENFALILDGLGEVCRDDPEIREALATASANIREASDRLAEFEV